MPTFEPVTVAAVQATPVILDADATVDKAVRLIADAAAEGAQLVVLPETFVSVYPSNIWARQAAGFGGSDELWERMWDSSVEVPGPLVDRLVAACAAENVHCAIGVNERELERPGTLYNTLLLLGPEGVLWKHRKLMPTHQERLFHGLGSGDDLSVVDTPFGRVGGLICWENRMPLARWAVYQGGPADLDRADRGRQRRLDREHAPHRDRVRRVRRLGASVHPACGVPGRLPARRCRTRRCSGTAAP